MIAVIIPIYNEEEVLVNNSAFFQNLARQVELIFVDGQSIDRSAEIAKEYGKVLYSQKGRPIQMNCGVRNSQSNILFFLHADSIVPQKTWTSIAKKLKDESYIGGCLTQRIAQPGLIYRFIENFGNFRARISKVFYGDQGIFVRRDIFLKLNGFPQVPIMEDVLFTKRLRKLGKTVILPEKIVVSARRWQKQGIIRTILFYSFLNILFWLHLPLPGVKSFYNDLR